MTTPPEAISLPDAPTDGITALSYLPNNNQTSLLASTSFDGAVRIHDTQERKLVLSQTMESGPLLSLATPKGVHAVVAGGLDGTVRMLDIHASLYQVIGRHTADESKLMGCSCLGALSSDIIASAGWNGKFHLWDVRQSSSTAAVSIDLPGKAFSMDVDPSNPNRVVVATAGRRICIVDVRHAADTNNWQATLAMNRESSLKYQTRTVRFFPDGNGIALGSIEGRVAVEFLEELGLPAKMSKKYAFKCHRQGDTVYPVNCIAFHPRYGTFATGGCDGTVVTWDGLHKKKLTTLPQFATSIAALAWNHDGSELAIASSYSYEDGEREHPRDEIFVRPVLEAECQPKAA